MKLRVLVVEDERHIARAVSHIIATRFSCELLDTASDGEEAWSMIQHNDYDLIISDWNMPNKTGEELLGDVRSLGRSRTLPFLMLTARSDRNSVIVAARAGVTDYLTKPFSKNQLIAKLEQMLAKFNLEIEAAPPSGGAPSSRPATSQSGKGGGSDNSELADDGDIAEIIDLISQRLKENSIEFPVLPDVAFKLSEVMRQPEVDVDDVVAVVQLDPGVTSRLIATSNSALFRGNQTNNTLEDAVIRLGLKRTQSIVLTSATGGLFNAERPEFEQVLSLLWQHSLATATCSKLIGDYLSIRQSEQLFMMGLLHDIGKLVLLKVVMDRFPKLDHSHIEELLNSLHTIAGSGLLRTWQFPLEIVEAALHHHDISYSRQFPLPLRIIAFSNHFSRTIGLSLRPNEEGEESTPEKLMKLYGLELAESQLGGLEEQVINAVGHLREAL